jgi:hypothetical protein
MSRERAHDVGHGLTGGLRGKSGYSTVVLLTPKEAAAILKVSTSWLAKARMRGDGPAYIQLGGRAIRYTDQALFNWTKSRQRFSTSGG